MEKVLTRTYSSKALIDCPAGRVFRFICKKCPRVGQYRRDTLIERFGPYAPVPGLPELVAADCPKIVQGNWYSDRCGVAFNHL